jgi:hypothetical protein
MQSAESRRSRLRTFVLGGLLGASAVLAAARRRRPRADRETPAGLAAFEGAPCFEETLQRERGTSL